MKNAGIKVFETEKTDMLISEESVTRKLKLENSAAKKLEETIRGLQLKVEDLNVFIDTDVAIISGLAYDQATREKVVLVVGNSNGISTVDDYMTVKKGEPGAHFYTVISGDTLGKIAKEYYGNEMNQEVIFDANKPMLIHPNKLYPGQVLRIPA